MRAYQCITQTDTNGYYILYKRGWTQKILQQKGHVLKVSGTQILQASITHVPLLFTFLLQEKKISWSTEEKCLQV